MCLLFLRFLSAGRADLSWGRYNFFFALYPIGITCECWLIWKACPFARAWDSRYAFFLQIVLLNYIPGKSIASCSLDFYYLMLRCRIVHSLLAYDEAEKACDERQSNSQCSSPDRN